MSCGGPLWIASDVRARSGQLGCTERNDLDQAHYEILGYHPDVPWTPCPPVRPFEADLVIVAAPDRPADKDAPESDGK